MHVLVTGLGGFTGGHLRTVLESVGHRVSGLECDLTDAGAVDEAVARIGPEAVVHLAGIAFVGHRGADAADYYRVNTIGTRNLLEALYRHAADQLHSVLLASSANVYGNRATGVLDESSPPDPPNDYAVSKLAMEYLARLWFERLPLVIARPFNYTGVGQDDKFLIPKIVNHFAAREPGIELGNTEVSREFNDVRAVAVIYQKLLEAAPHGQTFNVCTGRAHTVSDVLDVCARLTSHTLDVRFNPAFSRANDPPTLSGDCTRLRECIGDWPEYRLAETLAWMLES